MLNQAFALYSPETVAVELLQRAVAQIGEGWYQGDVTVQQEHFCSALAVRRLEALVMAAPPPTTSGPHPGCLSAGGAARHRPVAAHLPAAAAGMGRGLPGRQRARRATGNHGGGDPAPIGDHGCPAIAHGCDAEGGSPSCCSKEQVPLAYGGLIFNLLPALRQRIPGHFLGEQLEAAPQRVESLMTAPRPAPTPETVPDRYLQALGPLSGTPGLDRGARDPNAACDGLCPQPSGPGQSRAGLEYQRRP